MIKWIAPILIALITSATTITTVVVPRYFDYLEKKMRIETVKTFRDKKDYEITGKKKIELKDILSLKNMGDFISGKR
jgi:predicted AAA+ superfamily ATPase